jgi:O-antigen/teichoic acid export membrane protein
MSRIPITLADLFGAVRLIVVLAFGLALSRPLDRVIVRVYRAIWQLVLGLAGSAMLLFYWMPDRWRLGRPRPPYQSGGVIHHNKGID